MMMGLASEAYDRQYSDRQLVRRLATYFTPYRRSLLIVAGLVLMITVLGLLDPVIISRGLDAVRQHPSIDLSLFLFAYILTSQIIGYVTNMARRRYMARLIADVIS